MKKISCLVLALGIVSCSGGQSGGTGTTVISTPTPAPSYKPTPAPAPFRCPRIKKKPAPPVQTYGSYDSKPVAVNIPSTTVIVDNTVSPPKYTFVPTNAPPKTQDTTQKTTPVNDNKVNGAKNDICGKGNDICGNNISVVGDGNVVSQPAIT